jgi:DNA-binding Lrp family transcriptional regulator
MKNIRSEIIELVRSGYCAPSIIALARKLRMPSSTIHYNLRQMEREHLIKGYKAVFNHEKIGEGFCNFILINLSPDEYADPERIGNELLKFPQIESIDVITGGWEMMIKVRTRNIEEFYQFIRNVLSKKGITKITSLASLKQIKSEFMG